MRDTDGLLNFEDWCRIHRLVRKYVDPALWPSLRHMINQRREALRVEDMIQHRELVPEIVYMSEEIDAVVSDHIFKHF